MYLFLVHLSVLYHFISVHAALDLGYENDSDLTFFHSRPELRSPILDVQVFDQQALAPGYFFVGPYTALHHPEHVPKYYQACQTGPAIYDMSGELVWSGACLGRNQNALDFQSTSINGSDYLSAIMYRNGNDTAGHGMVMDSHFEVVAKVESGFLENGLNMHEFSLLSSARGMSAIHITAMSYQSDWRSLNKTTVNKSGQNRGIVLDTGIREVDVMTGNTLFTWQPSEHIPVNASNRPIDNSADGRSVSSWDWFHANSIDKNGDGDYLINARYTDAMYKVSGKTQSIEWQLGGDASSFLLDGFNFSRQHDARWLSHNDSVEIISFLDNGGDEEFRTANISSAFIVALEKKAQPPTARVISRIWRPDGQLSMLRGNYQTFSTSRNTFVGWSDNGYMTEHAEDGRMVLEARFRSKRFVTYRSYKFNFTGSPIEPPAVKAMVFGISEDTATTVAYASWNGATEVDSWSFYKDGPDPIWIGSQRKTGFETMFQANGYFESIVAEAVDKDGAALGRSVVQVVARPTSWGSERRAAEKQKISDEVQEEPLSEVDQVSKTIEVPHVTAEGKEEL